MAHCCWETKAEAASVVGPNKILDLELLGEKKTGQMERTRYKFTHSNANERGGG